MLVLQLVVPYTIMIITNKNQAVNLIIEQNCVAIFQGNSEWGMRALGNRSILFDATNNRAKEIVNRIKKREWWRPFGGTILLEHAAEWFDMGNLKESPYMSYAVNANQIAKNKIPSIIHQDNTCRIQTVTKQQNIHFYELIEEFYNKTGIPIVLNTSFNLAGESIVETIEDAISTTERSELKYIYAPVGNYE
jgi:carbamoyltransferase